ncbi:hypothetical protein BO443_30046 [Burkholderia orbicola]
MATWHTKQCVCGNRGTRVGYRVLGFCLVRDYSTHHNWQGRSRTAYTTGTRMLADAMWTYFGPCRFGSSQCFSLRARLSNC